MSETLRLATPRIAYTLLKLTNSLSGFRKALQSWVEHALVLNYQWPTTHPFSSVKESPRQRQNVFKVTRDGPKTNLILRHISLLLTINFIHTNFLQPIEIYFSSVPTLTTHRFFLYSIVVH